MFEVDTVSLAGCAQSIDDVASTLNRLESRLRGVQINSAMAGKSYGSIVSSVASVARKYSGKAVNARNLAGVTRSIAKLYADTENNIVNTSRSLLATSVKSQVATGGGYGGGGGQSTGKASTGKQPAMGDEGNPVISDSLDQFFEYMARIYEYYGTGKDGNPNGLGVTSGAIEYLVSLIKIFDVKNWKNRGYQELIDLASDSVGFLDPVYDLLGDDKTSGWLGGFSSVVGIYSTLVGLLEGNYKSGLDFISDWGDSTMDLLDIIEEKDPTGVIAALVKGGWGLAKGAAKSSDKYLWSDGKLSFDDFINMAYETSFSGLYGMVDGLSHGIVGEKTFGDAEAVSGALRDEAIAFGRQLRGHSN